MRRSKSPIFNGIRRMRPNHSEMVHEGVTLKFYSLCGFFMQFAVQSFKEIIKL